MSLGPDFPLMDSLNTKEAAVDFVTALTKVRWGRMGKDTSEITRFRNQNEVIEEEKGDKEAHMETREFKEERKTLDMSFKSKGYQLDLRYNNKIIFRNVKNLKNTNHN